jgi:hypothetical protein
MCAGTVALVLHLDRDLAARIDRGVGDRRNGLKRAKRGASFLFVLFGHVMSRAT